MKTNSFCNFGEEKVLGISPNNPIDWALDWLSVISGCRAEGAK